jgi:hypothetical protein
MIDTAALMSAMALVSVFPTVTTSSTGLRHLPRESALMWSSVGSSSYEKSSLVPYA